MRERGEFALALLLDLLGAAGALLVATRTWQTVTTPRPRPFRDDVLQLTGRTVDAAPTALALVALAGVIALLATRGIARRLIGAVLVLAGALLAERSIIATPAISLARARGLVAAHHAGVDAGAVRPRLEVHPSWGVLSACCGVLVLLAGMLVAWRGGRWSGMSRRYERPTAGEAGTRTATDTAGSDASAAERARADASLWTAIERGDDPTQS